MESFRFLRIIFCPLDDYAHDDVVVVDKKQQLVLPVRKLAGKSQSETLDFFLQQGQQSVHLLVRKRLVDTNNSSAKLGVPSDNIVRSNIGRSNSDRIAVSHGLDVELHDMLQSRPQHPRQSLPVLVQTSDTSFVTE